MSARLVRDGKALAEIPLRYAGTSSTFSGQLTFKMSGPFELEVLASDPINANFGMIRRKLHVAP